MITNDAVFSQQVRNRNRNRNKDKQTIGLILMLKNKYDKNVITLATPITNNSAISR